MQQANLFLLFTERFNRLEARYMVSGSVAAIIYGEPRLTHDVDLIVTLDTQQFERLPEYFTPEEFYCPPSELLGFELSRELRGHFYIIHIPSGFKADVYRSGRDPLHTWGFARARPLNLEGQLLMVAPPEYVILRKLEYFREGSSEKHLRDIRSILKVSSQEINHAELLEQITARGLEQVWEQV